MRALLVLAFLVLPLAAPAASAQLLPPASMVILVDPPTDPLVPEGPAQTLMATIQVTSSTPRGLGPQFVLLHVARAPAWAAVVVPDEVPIELRPEGTAWVGEARFEFTVKASRDAPAFVVEPVVLEALLRGDALQADAYAETTFPILPSWYALVDVESPSLVQVRPGETSTVPLKLTNFGNGNAKILFDLAQPVTRVQVGLPSPVTIESRVTGGGKTDATVFVRLQAPEDFRDSTKIELRLTPVYPLDARIRGEDILVSFVATTNEVSQHGATAPTTSTRGGWNGGDGMMPAASPPADPSDGSLRVQSAPESSWELPDGGPTYPLAGALVGGLVGLALARRRLRA